MSDAATRADPNELLTRKEVGRIIKVSATTVRRWDKAGLLPLPAFELGGVRRWRRADIDAWVRLQPWKMAGAKPDLPAPNRAKPDQKRPSPRAGPEGD